MTFTISLYMDDSQVHILALISQHILFLFNFLFSFCPLVVKVICALGRKKLKNKQKLKGNRTSHNTTTKSWDIPVPILICGYSSLICIYDMCSPYSPLHWSFCCLLVLSFTSESESRSVVSDSTVHGILQARILEWVAFPFSRDQIQVSRIAGGFFTS